MFACVRASRRKMVCIVNRGITGARANTNTWQLAPRTSLRSGQGALHCTRMQTWEEHAENHERFRAISSRTSCVQPPSESKWLRSGLLPVCFFLAFCLFLGWRRSLN